MYADTTITDHPAPNEAPQPGPLPADSIARPKPQRPPATLKSTARRYQKPDGRDRSLGESGDLYPGRLFDVTGTNWRVVVCARGYCWILQQREGKDHWAGRKFFSNRRRLSVVLKELIPAPAFQAVKDKIEALPI